MEKLLAYILYFSLVVGEEVEGAFVRKRGELIHLNPNVHP